MTAEGYYSKKSCLYKLLYGITLYVTMKREDTHMLQTGMLKA